MSEPVAVPQAQAQWEEVDLREYLKVLLKWKWVIAMLTISAVISSGVLSFYVLTPVYETRSIMMVAQGNNQRAVQQGQGLESVVNTVSQLPTMTINTYVGQMKNAVLLEQVVDDLGLKGKRSPMSLAGMIQVEAVKDTNLINVKVTHSDPYFAAAVANSLSSQFLEFISQSNRQQMTKSVGFLQEQLQAEDVNYKQAIQGLQESQSQPRGVAFLGQELQSRFDELTKYNSLANQLYVEISQLTVGRERLEQLVASTPQTIVVKRVPLEPVLPGETTAEQQPDGQQQAAAPLFIEDYQINQAHVSLIQQLHQRELQLAEKYAQLKSVEKTIQQQEAAIEQLQADLASKRTLESMLQQEVARSEQTRSLLQEKVTETKIAKSINLGDTSLIVVSPAVVPTSPVKPNKQLNLAIAGVLGIMVAVGLAFILEYFDNTIKTPDDIRRYLDLPLLGSIPQIDTADTEYDN